MIPHARHARLLVAAISLTWLTACGRIGYDSLLPADASLPFDGEADSGLDLAVDASADSAMDGSSDTGIDLAFDAGLDADVDAGMDMALVPTFEVAPTTGLMTTEAGGTATFTVRLLVAPSADVIVELASSSPAEATVAPLSLTFTPLNFNSLQTVTVTGIDDAIQDGNQAFTIVTTNSTTSGSYVGVDVSDVAGSNLDDESPGIIVTPTSGLSTTEAGGTATFTVALQSAPSATVTVPLASSDTTEGICSPASVAFNASNWNVPQVVTVTGVDDAIADGEQAYVVQVGPSSSTQPEYAGLSGSDVSVANEDDESARLVVSPLSGLTTSEAGGTATFSVELASEPTANVNVSVTSTVSAEGTPSPGLLIFTSLNWSAPQTVTLTGADDFVADGDQLYEAVVHVSASADAAYLAAADKRVSATNVDNETAGITVTPVSSLTTTESGGADTFTVVLNSQPTADVTIGLSSNTPAEGTVSPASLSFTTANWSMPRTVTVTGVDDVIADGARAYTIITASASSLDSNYNGTNPADVSVTNLDDDTASVTVSPTGGLVTTEGLGTDTFTVVLAAAPTADVTLTIMTSDATEGTVSPALLTFTSGNWSSPQTVTVTGVDDAVDDGNIAYTIVTSATASASSLYNGLIVADVSVTNSDNDTAGVTVTPTSGLTTTELGGTATFSVTLTSQPSGNVVISIATSDATEGTVSPASLTFTNGNWSVAQVVTVTGVDDAMADGNVAYTVITGAAASADLGYSGLAVADVGVNNTDNDSASVVVSPTSGLTTTEAGGMATFTLVLSSQPTANVVVMLSSSNAAEGSVSPASVTFTNGNWSTPQTVTITGVNDFVDDGDIGYSIVTSAAMSTDGAYSGLAVSDVTVTNSDNDAAGVTVSPTSGLVTTEALGFSTFTIVLTSEPTANVVIMLSSSNTLEGTVSPASVTFTNGNWSAAQTVTVTGVNDFVDDGDIAYTVVTSATASSDGAYSGLVVSDVSVTNTDNDTAGVTVSPTSGLTTTEVGGTAAFTLVLTAQPTSNVVIMLSSSNVAEGTVSPASVTFTNGNWSTTQMVTITGVNDLIDDGDVAYTIVTSAAASGDAAFSGLAVSDVSVTNTDNDTAGITVTPTSGLTTTEAGGTATFTVVLDTQPTGSVTIGISSSKVSEGTVNPASLTFTTGDWFTAQTVTITGVNDHVLDNLTAYVIVTAAATSSDGIYNGRNPSDVSVTNSGAVSQQAYVKSSNSGGGGAGDEFGTVLALSSDGNTMVVGAPVEQSNATGVGGSQSDNSLVAAGAAYVFVRSGTVWSQQAYIKASNTGANDRFAAFVTISGDGNTIAVGARQEASNATGIGGNQADNSLGIAGAVYVFTRSGVVWTQQAYIKASNTGMSDVFAAVTLSTVGDTLAVGAFGEASNATGIGGNQADNSLSNAGAVYVFTRSGVVWTQQAYIKASNTGMSDRFGFAVVLNSDGNTLAVGAPTEASAATGIGGNQADNTVANAGAVYVFTRAGTVWTQEAYVKASNTGTGDWFGSAVALSANGNTLGVGAPYERSNATGIGGNQADNSANSAGAVYVFTRAATVWTQEAYVKASNTDAQDFFGYTVSLSSTGDTMAVTAYQDASVATGINGNQADNTASHAGAAYLFSRTTTLWTQQYYVKASNTGASDSFGVGGAMSSDGSTFAAGAYGEDSNANGINGNQSDNSELSTGAVYVFTGL